RRGQGRHSATLRATTYWLDPPGAAAPAPASVPPPAGAVARSVLSRSRRSPGPPPVPEEPESDPTNDAERLATIVNPGMASPSSALVTTVSPAQQFLRSEEH